MTASKRSDQTGKSREEKKPLIPPPHTKNVWPRQAAASNVNRSAGRQAYTVHVARHDRSHHKPGR